MAKPYAGYKGNNLVDIVPRAIAFVTEGANKRRFFLFKHKPQGDNLMDKKVAISLIKSGNLTPDQVEAIVGAVAEEDRAEVLAVAKNKDPEGSAFQSFVKEFLPSMVKEAVKEAMKKEDPAAAGANAEEAGEEGLLKEILSKLDQLLSKEESEDEDLEKCVEEEEGKADDKYKALKKKWDEGTLDDAESKEYMKLKTEMRKRARDAMKTRKLKAEKEAIAELTDSERKQNQEGNLGAEGFSKSAKDIFSEDREITDPEEITKLMTIAQEAVEAGVL
jgi:hypothetical protein